MWGRFTQVLLYNSHKQWEQQQTMNKQQQNHRLRMDSTLAIGGRVNLLYLPNPTVILGTAFA